MSCNCQYCNAVRHQRLRDDLNAMYERRVETQRIETLADLYRPAETPVDESEWSVPPWLTLIACSITGLCFFWIVFAVGKEIGHKAGIF